MPIPNPLLTLAGNWSGENSLWLHPGDAARRSSASAQIFAEAERQSLSIRYQWADGDAPQSGILLLVSDAASDALLGSWTDSWHFGHQLMACQGAYGDLVASVSGSYAAPPGPDWGWRITLEPSGANACIFRMYNRKPEGEEALAVEMRFARAA